MPSQRSARAAQKELAAGDYYVSLLPREKISRSDFNDAEGYIHEIEGLVTLEGYSGNTLAEIGSFRAVQVDVEGAMSQHVSVHQVFDIYQETWSFYADLYDGIDFSAKVKKALDCEDEVVPWGLLILSRLTIKREFRGNRFGLEALKCLIQRYRMGAGIIAMKPFPLQFENEGENATEPELQGFSGSIEACTAKLRKYYGELGFKRIPRTPYMALATIYQLANLDDVEFKPLRLGTTSMSAAA